MFRNIRFAPIAVLFILVAVAGCRAQRDIAAGGIAAGGVSGSDSDDLTPPAGVVDTTVDVLLEGVPGPVPAPMPQPWPEDDVAPTPAPGGDLPPAAPSADDFASEVGSRSAIEADRARFLVRQKLDAARVHVDNFEYAKAEKLLNEALRLSPGNRDVVNTLQLVRDLRGARDAGAQGLAGSEAQRGSIRKEEQQYTARKFANVGRSHLINGRFDDAVESFEQAIFIMNASPYALDWGSTRRDAENGLRQAKYMKDQRAKGARREAIEDSLNTMAKQEEQRLLGQQAKLERYMAAGVEAFQRNNYSLAGDQAQRVLDAQPDNIKARELLMASQRADHDEVERSFLIDQKRRFREWMDDIQATRVPQQRIMKWPSQQFWTDMKNLRKRTRPSFGDIEVDEEAEALKKKIAGTSINLNVDNQNFKEVVDLLRVQTNYNIMIDARIAPDVDENPVVGLFLSDVRLDTALNLLMSRAGDDVIWMTRGNVVIFTKKEFVKKNLIVQIHSVADLTTGLVDFIPPRIQLVGPDDAGDEERPLFGGEGEDLKYPYGQIGDLIDLVKNSVDPGFWNNTEGADIVEQGQHAMVVKATPQIQEKVDRFLNDLRGFAGIVVTVETRFLEVGDNFLRDIGVDIRGLSGQSAAGENWGQLVNLDDVTSALPDQAGGTQDNNASGLPSAGAFFSDGGDGDFRGRNENIFDRPLGNVLSSLGGASITMAWIDDTEFQAILRATEKSADTRTLTAPRITVHNTQRANITVVNQLSYIQDFDVEVAQTSFIADPIVGIIQDGLTLDVRPTVSHDRRYITLELQPTVADLVEPIPTFATTLASSFTSVIIQLPELRLQQARTTVRLPDRGSILIGGLKNITTIDRQSQSPFLAKLPLLSFLFSRKGRSDEISNLMILVRAEITDLAEQEERLMGGR